MKRVFVFILLSWFFLQAEGKSQTDKMSSSKKGSSSLLKKKSAVISKRALLYNKKKRRKLAGGEELVCSDSFESKYKRSDVVFSVLCPNGGDTCSGFAWSTPNSCENGQLKQYRCDPSAEDGVSLKKIHDCEYGCDTHGLHCLKAPSG